MVNRNSTVCIGTLSETTSVYDMMNLRTRAQIVWKWLSKTLRLGGIKYTFEGASGWALV